MSSKLPKDVIAHWPEIFKDIEVHSVPLEYLDTVNITFHDGKVWQIDLKNPKKPLSEDLGEGLDTLFKEYEDTIEHIDFRINVQKIKQDISKRTTHFLKKRK